MHICRREVQDVFARLERDRPLRAVAGARLQVELGGNVRELHAHEPRVLPLVAVLDDDVDDPGFGVAEALEFASP
ncbi:hypothetical protein ACFPRL_17295 [Pseudoclavibacter helvolus]